MLKKFENVMLDVTAIQGMRVVGKYTSALQTQIAQVEILVGSEWVDMWRFKIRPENNRADERQKAFEQAKELCTAKMEQVAEWINGCRNGNNNETACPF